MKMFSFKRFLEPKLLFFLIFDVILIAAAVFFAFLLRFDGVVPNEYLQNASVQKIIFLTLIFCLPFFFFSRLYSFSWSYVGASEMVTLFKATTAAFLLLAVAIFFSRDFPGFEGLPRSVFFITYFLVFAFCGALRLSKRVYFMIFGNKSGLKEKTLIIGAGDSGEQILRSIISLKNSPYNVAGFIDDNEAKQGILIHGVPVLGKIPEMGKIILARQISQLIIAFPSAETKKVKNAVEVGRTAGIKKIKIVPQINEIIGGKISFNTLKDFNVEDLLGRDKITIDQNQIKDFIKNRVVLITGAAGSIGFELSMQAAKFNPSLLLMLDQDETGIFNISKKIEQAYPDLKTKFIIADVRDREKIRGVFKEFSPKIVFHAAAYKHVPLMEDFPDEAVKNNVFGTKILAETAVEFGVEKFVFISTDKAVNPVSVMGLTKRMGELICQAKNQEKSAKFMCVRFGNVLDSRGSVIPIFREQIKRGGPVTVTHPEMKRYFMLTSEACLLVLQAGAMGKGGEVFVLDMGKPVKIVDLAREMIRLSGYEPDKDIAIVYSGIRQGEKLFEEILTAEEGTRSTQNEKIYEANLLQVDKMVLDKIVGKLGISMDKAGAEEIKQELKIAVLLKDQIV